MINKLKEEILSALQMRIDQILFDKGEFAKDLDKILASRPTCGKEQRLFLDEIEKNYTYNEYMGHPKIAYETFIKNGIIQEHFTAKLRKVINGE
jgi:hypothetical protein